jgi:dTDP-4-dehydrorhamnose reductase
MRVLLLGGAGMFGTDLLASAPAGVSISAPTISEVDITDPEQLAAAFDAARPDWVINAAAYTAVDTAESEASIANRVNGDAPGLMAAECARRHVAIVHFSTDYVFPGTARAPYRESDPVDPVNAYGRSKLLGEQALLASGAHALIVRTQWLFGSAGKSFPRTMWDRARSGQATRVVNDQHGRPSYTKDIADATWSLIARGAAGIVHATNDGEPATWYELARRVFARAGAESLLSPCASEDYPTPAKRPAYSVLCTERLNTLLSRSLPSWHDALDRFLDEIGAAAPHTSPPRIIESQ